MLAQPLEDVDIAGLDPRTAMPNLGVDQTAARDIAAYLYTLK